MSCINKNKSNCNSLCSNIKILGIDDVSAITINGSDRTQLNWKQISVPEVLTVPSQKPDIENIDQIIIDVDLTCARLIETPFAFEVFERLATATEIAAVEAILGTIGALTIQPIIDAVNAILAIPGLPAIPAVAALQAALQLVEGAFAALTASVADITAILAGPCVIASVLIAALRALLLTVNALLSALDALILSANALAAATAAIPIVGPLVAAAIATLLAAINVVITSVEAIITSLINLIDSFGSTQFFTIMENEEGTCLSGRKIIVEGVLRQKVIYTALVPTQSVHSACFEVPFSTYVSAYANFVGLPFTENITVVDNAATCATTVISGFPFDPENPPMANLCEEFNVTAYVEDVCSFTLNERDIFKNVTLFLLAKPASTCVL